MTPLNSAQTSVLALIDKIFVELPHLAYVDRVWTMAIVRVESGFNAAAVGDHGSLGLAQVLPSTARDMGETGSQLDPEISLRTCVKYQDFCTRDIIRVWNAKYGGNINSVARSAVVEAYNEGQAAVEAGKRDDVYWYKVYAAWMILSAQIAAAQVMATHTAPRSMLSVHMTVTLP